MGLVEYSYDQMLEHEATRDLSSVEEPEEQERNQSENIGDWKGYEINFDNVYYQTSDNGDLIASNYEQDGFWINPLEYLIEKRGACEAYTPDGKKVYACLSKSGKLIVFTNRESEEALREICGYEQLGREELEELDDEANGGEE
ncbi:hypothetical protein IV38_GL000091 [Lactobacillus selangorensis]|uniref:Uncharacterized protein n=1 Tax=Lactobacillus selangorensis TaxID=81857 RepID=A0A0R2G1E7_9LACO|nr:hypothetical protein [Lactobacillus selangorensis]KRN29211.1 hypothetical protein IV38_GL000091 [Lactobacillus selangorensis]KRN31431.1 hypothetical protein IV40_GL001427 [Lactobacillus selangorensis]